MNVGDMVRVKNGGYPFILFPRVCMEDTYTFSPRDPEGIDFESGDLGVILELEEVPSEYHSEKTISYVRLLAPRGEGWGYTSWIEVVE